MSNTAHSQTRARSWALPRRHALKHRLRPSLRQVTTGAGCQHLPLAPLHHPRKGIRSGGHPMITLMPHGALASQQLYSTAPPSSTAHGHRHP